MSWLVFTSQFNLKKNLLAMRKDWISLSYFLCVGAESGDI